MSHFAPPTFSEKLHPCFEEAPEKGTFQEAPSEMEAPGTGLPPLAKIRGAAPADRKKKGRTGTQGQF